MPNSLNAAKRHRQSLTRRAANRVIRGRVRTSIKAFEQAVHDGDKNKAQDLYQDFVKKIDTARRKGVYHKNTAARKKSRMNKRLSLI